MKPPKLLSLINFQLSLMTLMMSSQKLKLNSRSPSQSSTQRISAIQLVPFELTTNSINYLIATFIKKTHFQQTLTTSYPTTENSSQSKVQVHLANSETILKASKITTSLTENY